MAMWSTVEREEINNAIMYEEDLRLLAYKAYGLASVDFKLKEVLKNPEFKQLTDYYTYDQIIDDVLRYYIPM